jgi:peptide subunit release factor 1 (eRF1)
MEILEKLENLTGCGTSMISMTISTNPKALDNAVTLLNTEFGVAANIKCRV